MKAFVLAAGMGSRLGELTTNTPKPMMQVKGRPLIDYTLNSLINQGVTDIGVNLHHHGNQIRQHIEKNYRSINVTFFYEDTLLDTGGALLNAQTFLNTSERFFILQNADVITDARLQPMLTAFERQQPLALLATSQRKTSRALHFDQHNQLTGRAQPNQTGAQAFNGLHIISPRLFEFINQYPMPFSIIDAYIDCAQKGERILSYDISNSQWFDVGTPARLAEANSADYEPALFRHPCA